MAALCVVYYHIMLRAGLGGGQFGSFGVDIFFVISGFIVCYITFHDPSQFIVKRIIRIVPIYWTATLVIATIVIVAPSLLLQARPTVAMTIESLLFIPYQSDGVVAPILSLGWTLNYEIYFYALFALGLLISRRFAPAICAVLILAICAALNLLSPGFPLAYYGDTIVIEFIFGMLVFYALRTLPNIARPAPQYDFGFFILLAVLAAAALWLPLRELGMVNLLPLVPRFIFCGLAALLIVFDALVLEIRYAVSSKNRLLLLLGEASYVLYLVHPYLLYAPLRLVRRDTLHLAFWEKAALALALILAAAMVATLIHLYFEKPVMRVLRRKSLHRPQPVIFESVPTAS